MGNHLVHGDTTSKEILIVECVEGPESERSVFPKFPDTVICNEVFTGYLGDLKKRKREICGGWIYLIRHLSAGGILPPQSMALVKDRLSPTRSSFSKMQPQNELWMKFHGACKWHRTELTVAECATVFNNTSGGILLCTSLPFNSDQLHHHCPDFYSSWK